MDCIFKLRAHLEVTWNISRDCIVADSGLGKEKFISSMLFVSLTHCDSIQILLEKRHFASAYALMRPLLETTYRAVWLNKCATEKQVMLRIEKDDWQNKSAWHHAQEIESKTGNAPILSKIWSDSRKLLHSYSHGGNQNAFRQLGDENWVTPNIPDEEIFQLSQVVALMIFVVCNELIELSENQDHIDTLEQLSNQIQQWAFNKSSQGTQKSCAPA